MLKTFIFGQFKTFKPFTHVFHLTKSQLLSINKLVYRYTDFYFESIKYASDDEDLSSTSIDDNQFNNIKSLGKILIVVFFPKKNYKLN